MFIKRTRDFTDNKSFGLVLTDINEVRNHIDFILDDIFVVLYQSDLCIEASTEYKNMT